MAPLTQQQFALQIIQQLRLLDPSISAEVGTPERKIIDTVAQSLTDSQIDLNALRAGLDLDSKFGDALDRFLALFGFARQKATAATGYVAFSRNVPALSDILIPANTQLRATITDSVGHSFDVYFYTTSSAVLLTGNTESDAVPIRARTTGEIGNVAANTITQFIGEPVPGITGVTNEVATRNGRNVEDDAEFKLRFKNTVFRNLAGTRDQYLALAIATQHSLRANVVGNQSIWSEYIQVPPVADNGAYDIDDNGSSEPGGGNANEYTTALFTLPYVKHIWTNLPVFVSSGTGLDLRFYRPQIDFTLNIDSVAKNRGDALRLFAAYGSINGAPDPTATPFQPNITFKTVYTGTNDEVEAIRPGDVVLAEYHYLSDASRNNIEERITNAVDVFVDGGFDQPATNILTAPTVGSAFVTDPASMYYYENYRRAGEPDKRPVLGNVLMPLLWQPVTSLPDQIVVGDNVYTEGVHYWLVEEIGDLGGSIRGRNGIEWSMYKKGVGTTPRLITEWVGGNSQPVLVEDYTYDRNIWDLQASIEAHRQITTDVLAHKAATRYFKFDITVMYTAGFNVAEVNQAIHDAVDQFLRSQYFGSVIQLSDVLSVIHSVSGVDNVRWSSDLPNNEDLARAYECDIYGKPILAVTYDYNFGGGKGQIYISGQPFKQVGGLDSRFRFLYNGSFSTGFVNLNTSLNVANDIKTQLETLPGIYIDTVVEDTRDTTVKNPIRSFTVTAPSITDPLDVYMVSYLKGGPTVLYRDFILRDNELAALPSYTYDSKVNNTVVWYGPNERVLPVDTVPGLIIRRRAQNTFLRG